MLIRYKSKIAYLISFSFVLFAFLASVHYCCFNEKFYTEQHNKLILYGYSINEYIGISDEDLKELTSFTLDYLNDYDLTLDKKMLIDGKNRNINNPNYPIEVFNDDEKLHMEDVRRLNINSVYLMYISLFVFSICAFTFIKNKFNNLFYYYKKTLIYTLIFVSILGVWILIDFDSFWTLFHHIFFTGNDLWLLSLKTDVLIMIVPPEFFYHLVIRIVISFITCIIIFGLVLYLHERRIKTND